MSPETKRLVDFIDRSIAGIVRDARTVPIEPGNLGILIEMAQAITALETLKRHLTA